MSFSPFDRAPCGLSVMPGSPPRGCGTARRIVSSCATEGYAGRATRYKPVPFDASVALNTGKCLKVAPRFTCCNAKLVTQSEVKRSSRDAVNSALRRSLEIHARDAGARLAAARDHVERFGLWPRPSNSLKEQGIFLREQGIPLRRSVFMATIRDLACRPMSREAADDPKAPFGCRLPSETCRRRDLNVATEIHRPTCRPNAASRLHWSKLRTHRFATAALFARGTMRRGRRRSGGIEGRLRSSRHRAGPKVFR